MQTGKLVKISTSEIKTTHFAPHGLVEISMDENLLRYEATGPFNQEVFDCLAVAQMNFLEALQPSGPWASICTVLQSAIATPDGIRRYTELMQTAKPPAFTPVATAFVMAPEVEGRTIMNPHFARIYNSIGRPFKMFGTKAEAQSWALSMIEASRAPC
jgi:hypothetical protein